MKLDLLGKESQNNCCYVSLAFQCTGIFPQIFQISTVITYNIAVTVGKRITGVRYFIATIL